MMRRNRMRTWMAITLVVPMSLVAACGSDDDEDDGGSSGDDTSATVEVDTDGAEPDKVLLAAIVLAAGDVDVALAEGLVTADEVDLAAEALESGTLSDWMDQAVTR